MDNEYKNITWDIIGDAIILKDGDKIIGKMFCQNLIEEMWVDAMKKSLSIQDLTLWKLAMLRFQGVSELLENESEDIPILTDVVELGDNIPVLTDVVND